MKSPPIFVAIALLTSACTILHGTVRIDVPYQAMGHAAPVVGAPAATVYVVAIDGRQ